MSDPTPTIRQLDGPTPVGDLVSRRRIRYLAQSVVLEETGNPRLAQLMILTVSLTVLAFCVWAVFTRIEEVASTTGRVVPSGQVQVVQHSEGGVVAAILVEEGDEVTSGQPLLRLETASLLTELQEMRLREISLRLQSERLSAFVNREPPEFSDVGPDYAGLVADQERFFQSQTAARTRQIRVIESRIRQREAELEQLGEQIRTQRKKVRLLEEEFRLREKLTERGLSSKMRFLEIQRDVNQSVGDLSKLETEERRSRDALAESLNSLTELDARLTNQAVSEMSVVRSELAQVQEAVKRLQSRVDSAEIRAKVAGVVQSLNVHSPGGVIAPRAVLLEIMPRGRELVVETQISSRDIGHVKPGQMVGVRFTAFDFARYGGVEGILTQISPTTFLDEKGQPYYKGLVTLSRFRVGPEHNSRPILPGMTVQANIKTGDKTVMEYLLKPIYISVGQALQER